MRIDRKELRKRMAEARKKDLEVTKAIQFPLPDLRGPGGNAFTLMAQASSLMKDAGVSESRVEDFKKEAISGTYEDLLVTIQEWFTVVVADVTYTPIGGRSILEFKPDGDEEYASWEAYDADQEQTVPEVIEEALEDFEAQAERDQQVADAEQKVIAQMRQELGLSADDVVIVKIVKAKKS